MSELHIVEYLGPDGEVYKIDLSKDNSGEPLSFDQQNILIGWAQSFAIGSMLAEYVHDYVYGEDDDDNGEEVNA